MAAGRGKLRHQPARSLQPATRQPADASNQTTYDAALQSLGHLFVTISATQFKTEFRQLADEHTKPFNPLTV
jgi:hypothetical protein